MNVFPNCTNLIYMCSQTKFPYLLCVKSLQELTGGLSKVDITQTLHVFQTKFPNLLCVKSWQELTGDLSKVDITQLSQFWKLYRICLWHIIWVIFTLLSKVDKSWQGICSKLTSRNYQNFWNNWIWLWYIIFPLLSKVDKRWQVGRVKFWSNFGDILCERSPTASLT